MSNFEYVNSMDDLFENILYLEKVRRDKNGSNFERYVTLIKKGQSFIAYPISEGIGFAPTKFLNARSNNFELHEKISAKLDSGNLTNRIDRIIGFERKPNNALKYEYHKFCTALGIDNPKTPNGYWNNPFDGDPTLLLQLLEDNLQTLDFHKSHISKPDRTTTKSQRIDARIGQGKFRKDLIGYWNGECCLTGCKVLTILRASHIKPWAVSTNKERLSLYNGLLMTPNLDALFDNGLISFENDGGIICSNRISKIELINLGCDITHKINFCKFHHRYLDYHRNHVLRS